MALSKIQAESMNLADTYAFTGTITGDNAGSMELIASDTSGGSGTTIEFDLSTNAKYFSQKLIVHGVYRTDGSDGDLQGEARNDADDTYLGSSLYTSICDYGAQLDGSMATGTSGAWNGNEFRIGGYNVGNHATEKDNVWEFDFYNTIGTTKRMAYIGRRVGHSSNATLAVETFSGRLLHNAQVDRFKLKNTSGATMAYAGYQLYGLLKA